jgi:hypothetical protein
MELREWKPSGIPIDPIVLSDAELDQLARMRRQWRLVGGVSLRASIILALSTGASISEVSYATGATKLTVAKWRTRFLARGIAGLQDGARAGRPRRPTGRHT